VSFDAIAPWYRALETVAFGSALQRARVAWLNEIGAPRRALIIGEGNGRFLGELLRTYPAVEVDCVDSSERMLALARQQIGEGGTDPRVHFLHADIRSWTLPPATYDLIVTHFLLDCFCEDEIVKTVARLANAATANASWLLADFREPSANIARLHARAWLFAMYQFFRFTARIEAHELIDPSPFVGRHGFTLEGQRLFRGGMVKSEIWRRMG
jgi:ubiquinone/menaquinone biosynthesis C-methylase UbiE